LVRWHGALSAGIPKNSSRLGEQGRDVRLDDPSDDLRFDGLVGVYQDVPGANQILPRNFGVRDAKLCIT
jgi:hypothetical protein